MSLTTPTTAEINANIIAQLEAALSQSIPLLPKAFLRVLAKALAAVFILLYKYGGFTFLQMFVSTASDQPTEINGKTIVPLTEWGRLIGVGDPVAATQAELLIDITVENQVGVLPSGTQLLGAINGVTYILIGSVVLSAASVPGTVRAVADQSGGGGEGVIGNLSPGDELSFANPLANVSRVTVVNTQTVTGANAESTAAYRQRVQDRWQKRLQGGALSDYEAWGEEVAGIINVYPYTGTDPGEVDVYSEATVASSGSADGIPTAAQLTTVLESVNLDSDGLATRRPANAFVNSNPITRKGFVTVVDGISGVDDLGAVQTAINSAVDGYFAAAEPFIDGLTLPPRRDRLTRSALIGLVEDIITASNGIFTDVTFALSSGGGNIELYTLGRGEKAKDDGVTYT